MRGQRDGAASPLFTTVRIKGNANWGSLAKAGVSKETAERAGEAPRGACVGWGIPFEVGRPVVIAEKAVTVDVGSVRARWLVFMHASDTRELEENADGFVSPARGQGHLGEHAADTVIVYADGVEERAQVRRSREIGLALHGWGLSCFGAVPHRKPRPMQSGAGQAVTNEGWGWRQCRATAGDMLPWVNWLWAWENPRPTKAIRGIRFEPVSGAVIISAVTAGRVESQPLRWRTRRKAVLALARGEAFTGDVDEDGLLEEVQLDMGQVISAVKRPIYPNARWAKSHEDEMPEMSEREALVEYTCHPEARFHLGGGRTIRAAALEEKGKAGRLQAVAPTERRVRIRVVERGTGKAVPVRLHVHGEAGEHLAPVDRHRIPNPIWFQDYAADVARGDVHFATYIDGETTVDLPVGRVYVEVTKGFEVRPVRQVMRVGRGTREIVIEIEKVLGWRERGWVTADTHVHFLSPKTAQLEGAGEGVNVVNLLASQWGEMMTNVGDFDGKTTFGSREAGGDGEYLVRVGSENRQHVLGHISLLGYEGNGLIAPMTTGGPDESALGDPVGSLLTEWARECRRRNGVVIVPHFPNPRGEQAAAIVSGEVEAVEMVGGMFVGGGIWAYSLSDDYRYLNCGFMVGIAGGTDKMRGNMVLGGMRTYARIWKGEGFTYETWKAAVRRAETFVTCGPLLAFEVEGRPAGSRIKMGAGGGTVTVSWEVASVTLPASRVELVVNGEIREGRAVPGEGGRGEWKVKVEKSSWLALLVRGQREGEEAVIGAHSSPVMVEVAGTPFGSAADAVTILEQIEGALAYLDSVGTRAEARRMKEMRLVLATAHREVHHRMHQAGRYHEHTPADDHAEHH